MLALALAALLCAQGSPTAADAKSLLAAKKWDELYLRFASAKPDAYSAADRKAISQALLTAAKGLASDDKALAFSSAEAAARFEPRLLTYLYAAELARGMNNPGQASDMLDKAIALDGKNAKALVARADLAMAEADHALALKLFERVPRASPESAKARAGAKAAKQALEQNRAAAGEVRKLEKDLATGKAFTRQTPPIAHEPPAGESKALGLQGMRKRESKYFHFIYSGEGKDFAVRADYEGKVLDALEEARRFVEKEWGQAREKPVDVVLYTKEEYELHFGGSSLGRALGFYSGKIRVSNAAEITPELSAVIVHEYVHAVVDELVSGKPVPPWIQEGTATVVEQQYRGSPEGSSPAGINKRLRDLARSNRLPPLQTLNTSFIEMEDPTIAYHFSAAAVRELISRGGIGKYLEFLQDVGRGKPFRSAFAAHYFPSLAELDEAVRSELERK
jgi:tetratricopeptide (TPR) repeat protein